MSNNSSPLPPYKSPVLELLVSQFPKLLARLLDDALKNEVRISNLWLQYRKSWWSTSRPIPKIDRGALPHYERATTTHLTK